MGNMSYCRFENTTKDLQDCLGAIECNEINELSSYEMEALREMQGYAKRIIDASHLISAGLEASAAHNTDNDGDTY